MPAARATGYWILCFCFAFLAPVWPVYGSVYSSPKGYQLTVPDGWLMFPGAKTTGNDVEGIFIKTTADSTPPNVDFGNCDMLIVAPEQDLPPPSISVIVQPGRATLDTDSVPGISSGLFKAYAGKSVPGLVKRIPVDPKVVEMAPFIVSDFDCQWTRVGNYKAISMTLTTQQRFETFRTHYWQVMVPGKDQTLVITCTALESRYASMEPEFQSVLASLHVEGATSEVPLWSNPAVIGGAAGVFILALVLFFLVRRQKRAANLKAVQSVPASRHDAV